MEWRDDVNVEPQAKANIGIRRLHSSDNTREDPCGVKGYQVPERLLGDDSSRPDFCRFACLLPS